MAVIRTEKNTNYTTMSNYHLKDRRLTLKAKGLLSLVLSLPDEWHYSVEGISKICLEGRDAVQAALGELERNGYLIRRRLRTKEGKLAGVEYVIYERPQGGKGRDPREPDASDTGLQGDGEAAEKARPEEVSMDESHTGRTEKEGTAEDGSFSGKTDASEPLAGKPVTENPYTEKPVTGKPVTDNPYMDKPYAGRPYTENPQQLITNRSNTNLSNTKRERSLAGGLGPYRNVFLSEEELRQLRAEFPGDHEERIARLSLYMASTGKTYRNHLATIRKWADDDRGRLARADPKDMPYSPDRYRFREGESL